MAIKNEISMPSIETQRQTLPIKRKMNDYMDQYKSWSELNTHAKFN